MNAKKAVATVTSHLGGCANNAKVLGIIFYSLACLFLLGLTWWGMWTMPDSHCRWFLEDSFQYFIPLVWIFGTVAIIGKKK